ncbi:hypothetical protein D1007_04584 [Hordeum vulgare]|nr:hypothetical protein D1007_04584 [Hordeum vulgare]
MQYSQDLKEHVAAEKQITVAHVDEADMASMHADPHILEWHLAVEATIDASRATSTTWLAALNNNSLCFLKGFDGAFDDDNELFSQCALVFVNSRAGRNHSNI